MTDQPLEPIDGDVLDINQITDTGEVLIKVMDYHGNIYVERYVLHSVSIVEDTSKYE